MGWFIHGTKALYILTHLTRPSDVMIELTIRVPEAVAPEIKMLAEKLASVVEGRDDDWLEGDDFNAFFKMAIDELRNDRVIVRPRDYGWIMAALDQGVVADIERFAYKLSKVSETNGRSACSFQNDYSKCIQQCGRRLS